MIATYTTAPAAEEMWGKPIPLGAGSPAPIPMHGLPDWLRRFVENVADAVQAPGDLVFVQALSALSVTVANKARIEVRAGQLEPLNVYTCAVLEPGTRKSPVAKQAVAPIWAWEKAKRKSMWPAYVEACDCRDMLEKRLERAKRDAAKANNDVALGEAIEKVKATRRALEELHVPVLPRLLVDDITSERLAQIMAENDGRVGNQSPEGDLFRIMAGRYSSGVSFDLYKRGWTGDEPFRDDRVGRDGTYIPRPAITLGLCAQPSVFRTLEEKESFRGEGLLARFLFVVPPDRVGFRLTGDKAPALDLAICEDYRRALHRLLNDTSPKNAQGEWEPRILKLAPDARASFFALEAAVEQEMKPGGLYAGLRDWAAKLPGQVVRIAGLLHIAERVGRDQPLWDAEVSYEAMAAAIEIGGALAPHAAALFDLLDSDAAVSLARYVVRRIQAGRPETVRDLFRACQGKREVRRVSDLNAPLELLSDHNYIEIVPQASSGGRPLSPLLYLNPALTQKSDTSDTSPPSVTSVTAQSDVEKTNARGTIAEAGRMSVDDEQDVDADLSRALKGAG